MGFKSGTISLTVCTAGTNKLPADWAARFAAIALPPDALIRHERCCGWTTSRHLADREITEDSARVGGYVHLVLVSAERKIPGELLKSECQRAEIERLRVTGFSALSRKMRKEIHDSVVDALRPSMPLTLTGIPFVLDEAAGLVYVGATTRAKLDLFLAAWHKALGWEPTPLSVQEIAALGGFRGDLHVLEYSPDLPGVMGAGTFGQSFLTWLWYYLETHDGMMTTNEGSFGIMLDGPLIFVGDGPGARVSGVAKGLPTASGEAKAALLSGKKLLRARILVARGKGEEWRATFHADAFAFTGLRLPEGEAIDPASIFEERMTRLWVFWRLIRALVGRYVTDTTDPQLLADTSREIKKWSSQHAGR